MKVVDILFEVDQEIASLIHLIFLQLINTYQLKKYLTYLLEMPRFF